MSAAFKFRDFECAGTNGTIETYVERICELAVEVPGIDSTLLDWLTGERDAFFTGKVVFLDQVLLTSNLVEQFLRLFDRATTEFLAGDLFTDYGKQWLRDVPSEFHTHLLGAIA